LYQDGDLVMITPDAVKGIIEVKSTIDISEFRGIANKLAGNAEFILRDQSEDTSIFVGLFTYDSEITSNHSKRILNELQSIAEENKNQVINHLSLGKSLFIRYWASSPTRERDYNKWHSYLLESKAAGYFINNVVDSVAEDSVDLNQD